MEKYNTDTEKQITTSNLHNHSLFYDKDSDPICGAIPLDVSCIDILYVLLNVCTTINGFLNIQVSWDPILKRLKLSTENIDDNSIIHVYLKVRTDVHGNIPDDIVSPNSVAYDIIDFRYLVAFSSSSLEGFGGFTFSSSKVCTEGLDSNGQIHSRKESYQYEPFTADTNNQDQETDEDKFILLRKIFTAHNIDRFRDVPSDCKYVVAGKSIPCVYPTLLGVGRVVDSICRKLSPEYVKTELGIASLVYIPSDRVRTFRKKTRECWRKGNSICVYPLGIFLDIDNDLTLKNGSSQTVPPQTSSDKKQQQEKRLPHQRTRVNPDSLSHFLAILEDLQIGFEVIFDISLSIFLILNHSMDSNGNQEFTSRHSRMDRK